MDHNEVLNYLDGFVSDEDKAKIEASLSDEEFLTLMEVNHGLFNRWDRWNLTVNLSSAMVIHQEVTKSCSKQEVILYRKSEKESWKMRNWKKSCYRKSKNQAREA